METVTKTLSQKAIRLSESGNVHRVKAHVYRVIGDHDEYRVVVGSAVEVSGACSCPARGTCSHLIAACAYDLTFEEPASNLDPFRGIL